MRKIEFDTTNGIYEVLDFSDSTDFLGCFSDHHASPEFLGYFQENFGGTRGMEVGEKVFEMLDAEYGIASL